MKQYSKRTLLGALFLSVVLTGCLAPVPDTPRDPASRFQSPELMTTTFVASDGVRYQIKHTFSRSISRYGVEIEAVSGAPLTNTPSGDARAQNAIRDYFNAQVCSAGNFAGIVAIAYQPAPDRRENSFGANLFCTTKQQANI